LFESVLVVLRYTADSIQRKLKLKQPWKITFSKLHKFMKFMKSVKLYNPLFNFSSPYSWCACGDSSITALYLSRNYKIYISTSK